MLVLLISAFILIAVLWRQLSELRQETERQIAELHADSRRHHDTIAHLLWTTHTAASPVSPMAEPVPGAVSAPPLPQFEPVTRIPAIKVVAPSPQPAAGATSAVAEEGTASPVSPKAEPVPGAVSAPPLPQFEPVTPIPAIKVVAPSPQPAAGATSAVVEEVTASPVSPKAEPVPGAVSAPPLPQLEPVTRKPAMEDFASPEAPQAGGWEALIGGNLLNKLGAVMLVIGLALFLGHSFTRLGPGGRAATAVAIGAAMLAIGVRLERNERYQVFSRGLMAAGWATLYVTSYAMSAVPAAKVINSPLAGVSLMLAVAAGMVLHSLRFKVESLTALAFACVFAALALSDINMLTAAALIPLAAAMIYLAGRLAWDGLALFGAAATYATFLSRESPGAPLAPVQTMLLIYWLLFEGSDLLRIAAGRGEGRYGPSLFGLNALAGLGASAAIWSRMAPGEIWQYCAAGSALYLGSTAIRVRLQGNARSELALTAAAAMAALAIFAHVPGIWVSVGIMIEAEALFLAGLHLGLRWARPLSLLAFAVAAADIFSRSHSELGPALTLLAAVFYANRFLAQDAHYFSYAASALLAIVIGVEAPWQYASLGWLLFGTALFEFGVSKRLPEFRFQSYGLTLLGALGAGLGHLDPSQAVSIWTYAVALGVSLLRAIRATSPLHGMPELERQSLRISGAGGAALMAGLLAAQLVPGGYLGLAVLAASLALIELALRRLPPELAIPSTLLAAAGLLHLVWQHASQVGKDAAPPVWISFAGGAAVCYLLAARLNHRDEAECRSAQIAALWAGSVLAMTELWMLLPVAAVPLAWGLLALAVAEAFMAATATASLIAMAAGALALGTGEWRLFNGCALAAAHWALQYRLRNRVRFAPAHGWLAVFLIMAASACELPHHYLLVWSGLGFGLPLLARQQQQGALVATAALGSAVFLGEEAGGWWQHGVVALWFLAVLAWRLTREEWRPGYSIATALVVASALFREASGGLLTLSWSAEGIGLLATGFVLGERTLRLSALALLLGCIGKAFLYDLRNLETTYRILSFVGLGAILLVVSALYTKHKDTLQKHL